MGPIVGWRRLGGVVGDGRLQSYSDAQAFWRQRETGLRAEPSGRLSNRTEKPGGSRKEMRSYRVAKFNSLLGGNVTR